MDDRLAKLKKLIEDKFPDSDLTPLSEDELVAIRQAHPDVPEHLLDFYATAGCGRVGSSRYMIHELLPPSDIYDAQTALDLGQVMIVGDDFAGNCEAYDVANGWAFGSIGAYGTFESMGDEYPTIVDWLHFLFVDD